MGLFACDEENRFITLVRGPNVIKVFAAVIDEFS
jgi:hypothetical protein